jgi:hypothetical protein
MSMPNYAIKILFFKGFIFTELSLALSEQHAQIVFNFFNAIKI